MLALNSCGTNKLLGAYSSSESANNVEKFERLKLEKNLEFIYYCNYSRYDGGKENQSVAFSGFGQYRIEKDSIHLKFKRKDFELNEIEFNEIYEKHFKTNKKELDVKIVFNDALNVRVLKNNKEISASGFDGVATFKIDITELPLELTFDFSQSNLSMYKNYVHRLVSKTDYQIFVTISNPVMFKKDLVFPIYKTDKNNWKIGRMNKNML